MSLKTKVLIAGGVLGALVGVGAALLYLRTATVETDAEGGKRLPAVHPGKVLSIALGLLTVVKQIAGLGQPA